MINKILTISIAAYNVEKYIKNALDSFLATEILDDIEVLVIDDGSTDITYSIAKEYEELYPNSFKVIHKENSGYGSTVNYSINNATGKYFKLLDGDDWFSKDGLIKLVNRLKQIDVDMVITNFCKVFKTKNVNALCIKKYPTDTITGIEKLNINEGFPMHAITYKTEILRDSKLILKEHLLYTDNYYVAIPIAKVKKVVFYDFIVYNYRLDNFGQSVDRKVNAKHINESRIISLDLVNYFNYLNIKKVIGYQYMCARIASTCVDYIAAAMTLPISTQSLNMIVSFENEIRSISSEVYFKIESLDRKASKTIRLLRKTNYIAYWPISLIRKFI